MPAPQPEKRPGIFKYSTANGATWNGYKLDIKRSGTRYYETYPITRYRASWVSAGRAVLKRFNEINAIHNYTPTKS